MGDKARKHHFQKVFLLFPMHSLQIRAVATY